MATKTPIEPALDDYVRDLRRGWKVVAVVTLVLMAVGLGLSMRQGKVYRASLDILVQKAPGRIDMLSEAPPDINTEILLARSAVVRDLAGDRLGFPFTASLHRVGDSSVVRLTVEADSTARAAKAADIYAAVFVETRIGQLVAPLEETRLELQGRLSTVGGATGPLDQAQVGQVAELVEGVMNAVESRDAGSLRSAVAALQASVGGASSQVGVGEAIRGAALLLLIDELDAVERLVRNSAPGVVGTALASASPVRPAPLRNTLVAAVLGLLLGGGAVMVRSYLDRRVNDAELLLLATGLPVLAVLAQAGHGGSGPRNGLGAERLDVQEFRAALQLRGVGEDLRTIQLTAAHLRADLGAVAADLATAFARASRAVIILDVDFRAARASRDAHSRSSALTVDVDVLLATAPAVDGVRTVRMEEVPEDAGAFLGSPRFCDLVMALRERADVVVLVSPPVMESPDALLVGQVADATVLAVLLGTRVADVAGAVERLRGVRAPTLGTVLTGVGRGGAGLSRPSAVGSTPNNPGAHHRNGSSQPAVQTELGRELHGR
jgi:hypothetical protein